MNNEKTPYASKAYGVFSLSYKSVLERYYGLCDYFTMVTGQGAL